MDSVGVKWPLFGLACLIFGGLWLWLPWPTAVSHGFALLVFIAFLWLTETLQVTLTALLVPICAVVLQILTLPQALSHFANPVLYLFLGGFALAAGLHRQQVRS